MKLSGRSHTRYVLLDDRMNDEQVDRFKDIELPGIYMEPITVRDYPQGPLAGTLLGFVGRDGEGLEGLERHWEERLLAKAGSFKFMRDYKRRRMWVNGEDSSHSRTARTCGFPSTLTFSVYARRTQSNHRTVRGPTRGRSL